MHEIKPDKIKKGLEYCGQAISCYDCPYFDGDDCEETLEDDALALIQQLEKIVFDQNMVILGKQNVITGQERVRANLQEEIWQMKRQVPKWISVEEQPEPPEDDVYYCYGYWLGSGRKQAVPAAFAWGEWKIANNFVLTHWVPLPEPPEED